MREQAQRDEETCYKLSLDPAIKKWPAQRVWEESSVGIILKGEGMIREQTRAGRAPRD